MSEKLRSYDTQDVLYWLNRNLSIVDIPGLTTTFLNNDQAAVFAQGSEMTFESLLDWLLFSNTSGYTTLIKIIETLVALDSILSERNIQSLTFDFDIHLNRIAGGNGKISKLLKVLIDLQSFPGFPGFYDWLRYDLGDVYATEAAEKMAKIATVEQNIHQIQSVISM